MKNQTRDQKSPTAQTKSAKRGRKIAIAIAIILAIPLLLLGVAVAAFAIWAKGVPLDETLLPTMKAAPTFFDADGNIIYSDDGGYLDVEELRGLDGKLKNAFVAVEDKRFYAHKGYDIKRMIGATLSNIKAGAVREGASTITQQLVKNTHLTHERTVKRKLREIAIAQKLEKRYSKNEILAMYLSVIYFGSGAYGIKEAARTYFDKELDELSLGECAALAGTVKNPARYAPKNIETCKERRNKVLSLMLEQGYISKTEYLNASKEDIILASPTEREGNALYVRLAKEQLSNALGMTKYQLDNSGVKVYTYLEPELDNLYQNDGVNSAQIILDDKAHVLSYASDLSYPVKRQPGSILKPLAVYVPAFDMGLISPSTPIVDEKVDFAGYSPNNFGGIYLGETTLKEAIAKSLNSVSLKTLDYVGIERAAKYLEAFDIDVDEGDMNYALALGAMTKGVDPLSIAAAYSALANRGIFRPASFVRYAVIDGKKIYTDSDDGRRMISKGAASLMTYSLSYAAKNGTARTLGSLDFEVAAKTGTAERANGRNSDAWCVSYNDGATVLIWRGSDDGMSEKGGGMAAHISLKIWKKLNEMTPFAKRICLEDVEEGYIDAYSTAKCKRIVAATPFTPSKFVEKELFILGGAPDAYGSRFDNSLPLELNAALRDGVVELSFDIEEIFGYELKRVDLVGEHIIFSARGESREIRLSDRPISLGGRVRYLLTRTLDGFEDVTISQDVYCNIGFTKTAL